MLWVGDIIFNIIVFMFLSIIPAVGILFIYSAITGKFLVKPLEDEQWHLHISYRFRGIIGIGILIFSFWIFWDFLRDIS